MELEELNRAPVIYRSEELPIWACVIYLVVTVSRQGSFKENTAAAEITVFYKQQLVSSCTIKDETTLTIKISL